MHLFQNKEIKGEMDRMKIWLINNYTALPEHGPMTRQYYFAKELAALGHDVTVFAGSHVHNTDVQLVDGVLWKIWQKNPFCWVYIHTLAYGRSRKKQVFSMFQFYRNMSLAAKYFRENYGTPDVVLGSSAHPLTALLAVRLGKKFHCKSVAEIRDLWPESIVAYGVAGSRNPAVIALRWLERWIYKKADAVIFTMEGAYDYIVERGWEKDVPREKVYYINNGVDLPVFDYNSEHYRLEDKDLDDPSTFKFVYAGSLRKSNHMGLLLDAAKLVKNPKARFLIWGAGDEVEMLRRRVREESITNVILKGSVEKKYIPGIVCRSDVNMLHMGSDEILRFGVSFNKLFEAMAARKPILSGFTTLYNPAQQRNAGLAVSEVTPEQLADAIERFLTMDTEMYQAMCENARCAAEAYDYRQLTRKLIGIIGRIL